MKIIESQKLMLRALELAKTSEGRTFPNPLVGAIVVKDGKIVGEGYHKRAGDRHAEIAALSAAGKRAKNADLYITLEPCAHYGKTPPCVDKIIRSGVKRVYVAMRDPNPIVDGKGIKILKSNNIEVRTGICKKEAEKLNRVYLEVVKKNRK